MTDCKAPKTIIRHSVILLLVFLSFSCSKTEQEPLTTITGNIYNASFPSGKNIPVSDARIEYAHKTATSNQKGEFTIETPKGADPLLTITAKNFHTYKEKYSRSKNGSFYLIPESLYRDFKLLTWKKTAKNEQNWHKKWAVQPELYIIKNKASKNQINFLINTLKEDKLPLLTAGLYHSDLKITILDNDPDWSDKQKFGKIIFHFTDGIIEGGIAYSADKDANGIIEYAEAFYDTKQKMFKNIIWHEISHMITAGGHINYRPSINNEGKAATEISDEDIKVFNCIYNSPPKRSN